MGFLNYIRILDGKFVITDSRNTKYIEFLDSEVNKENLKNQIIKQVEKAKTPVKVRDLIYSSLSIIARCEVKKPCKQVLEQEATDPLYQELSQFVLSLEQYQNLTKSSKTLKITNDTFIISDINGIISITQNEEIDTRAIEEIIDSLESIDKNATKKNILVNIFIDYFDVKTVALNLSNALVRLLLQKVCNSKVYICNMKAKIVTGFKDGKIFVKLEGNYLPLEPHITVEALKEQIILYLNTNKNAAHKNEIIFSSLKALTGYKVSTAVSRYIPTYIGENKVKKEILVEDPLYVELCDFLETLPVFLENRKRKGEQNKRINDTLKKFKSKDELERFLDRRTNYYLSMTIYN